MPRAYSDDLRRKLLEAYEAGDGTLEELAERFRVSESWAKKISASYKRTQKMERPTGGKPGRKSKVTAEVEQCLRQAIQRRPDLTLQQLRGQLEQDQRVNISIGWLWTVLERWDLNFKKKSARD